MDIYVIIDGEPHGPYTAALVRQYLKSGELQPEQMGAYAGSSDWVALSAMVKSWDAAPPGKAKNAPGSVRPKSPTRKLLVPIILGVLVLIAGGVGLGWRKFFGDSGPVLQVTTPVPVGYPTTPAELNAWYVEPPPGSNAAGHFVRACELVTSHIEAADYSSKDLPFVGKAPAPALGQPLNKSIVTAATTLSKRIGADSGKAFAELNLGLQLEKCRYPMDLNQGAMTLLPHLAKIKNFIRYDVLVAVQTANQTAPAFGANLQAPSENAAGEIAAAVNLSRSLEQEPLLISQLVRVSGYALATTGLEQIINRTPISAQALANLQNAFGRAEATEADGIGFQRAIAGERSSILSCFDLPPEKLADLLKNTGGGKPDETNPAQQAVGIVALKKLTRNLKSQRAFAEETFNQMLAMRQTAFPARLKTKNYFAGRMDEVRTNDFGLCQLLLPALGNQVIKEAGSLAELRLAVNGLALEQYRFSHGGTYPATFAELAPTPVPSNTDPFDGQPLRYRRTATGYVLYSIGPDLQDNHGNRESGGKGDLVFEVVTAPKAILRTSSTDLNR